MDHLSYSSIDTFRRCGEQYRQRYIEGRIQPPGIAMLKGSGVHKGAEANWVQKIESHQDMKKTDIIAAAASGFEEKVDKAGEIMLNDEERTEGKDKVIGKALDSIVSLAGLYADEMAPTIQPTAAELKLEQEIEGIKILSFIDLVDDKSNIRDMKVTGKSKSQNDVDSSSQLTLCAIAYMKEFGPHGSLIIDNLVETKVPKYVSLTTKRDDNDYIRLIKTIQAVGNAIKTGVFLPPTDGHWVCSPRFCGYYGSCEYTRKGGF